MNIAIHQFPKQQENYLVPSFDALMSDLTSQTLFEADDSLGCDLAFLATHDDTTDDEEVPYHPLDEFLNHDHAIAQINDVNPNLDFNSPPRNNSEIILSLPPMLLRLTKSLPTSPVAQFQYLQWSAPKQDYVAFKSIPEYMMELKSQGEVSRAHTPSLDLPQGTLSLFPPFFKDVLLNLPPLESPARSNFIENTHS